MKGLLLDISIFLNNCIYIQFIFEKSKNQENILTVAASFVTPPKN